MRPRKPRAPRQVGLTFVDDLARSILAGEKTETRRPLFRSPKVQAGDELYARVTYAPCENGVPLYRYTLSDALTLEDLSAACTWTPAIHMPKVHAPFFLPIIEVFEESLHDITEEGAKAEGAGPMFITDLATFMNKGALPESTHRNGFRSLWDEVYGKTPNAWDKNPHVRGYRWKEIRRC